MPETLRVNVELIETHLFFDQFVALLSGLAVAFKRKFTKIVRFR